MIFEITNRRKLSNFILNIVEDNKVYDTSKTRAQGVYSKNILDENIIPNEDVTFLYDKYYLGLKKIESLSCIHRCILPKDHFSKMTSEELEDYKKRLIKHCDIEKRKGIISLLKNEDFNTNQWVEKVLESVPRLDIRVWTPFNISEERISEDIIANVYLDDDGMISKKRLTTQSHSERLSELAKKSGISENELQKENIKEVQRIILMITILKGENALCHAKS